MQVISAAANSRRKHVTYRCAPLDRGLGNLVVDGVGVVERCQPVGITGVEELDPPSDDFLRGHARILPTSHCRFGR